MQPTLIHRRTTKADGDLRLVNKLWTTEVVRVRLREVASSVY